MESAVRPCPNIFVSVGHSGGSEEAVGVPALRNNLFGVVDVGEAYFYVSG